MENLEFLKFQSPKLTTQVAIFNGKNSHLDGYFKITTQVAILNGKNSMGKIAT